MDHNYSNIIEDVRTPGCHLRGMIQFLYRQGLFLRDNATTVVYSHTNVFYKL